LPSDPKPFHTLAHNTATLLKPLLPGAKSDPFFVQRMFTHFVLGVENPRDYQDVLKLAAERRREAARQAEATGPRASPVKKAPRRKPRAARRDAGSPGEPTPLAAMEAKAP
jgi:hypothetical protein